MEARDYFQKAFKGRCNLYKAKAEIAKLERLVGQLYAENALLKKAITSAQEKRAEELKRRLAVE